MVFFENLRERLIHDNIVTPLAQGEAYAEIKKLDEQGIPVTPDTAKLIRNAALRNQIDKQEGIQGQSSESENQA